MHESDFTANIHKKIDPTIVKAWKIKDDYQGGIYDAAYFAKVNENNLIQIPPVFIEYKLIKALPKRKNTLIVPALSELQKEWLRIGVVAALPVYVIVGLSEPGRPAKGVVYMNEAEWLNGITQEEFAQRLQGYSELAEFITKQLTGCPPSV